MLDEYGQVWTKGLDQVALAMVLTPAAYNDSLVHDSYLCNEDRVLRGGQQLPFPTRRVVGSNLTLPAEPNFVGNTGNYAIYDVCPEVCRPEDHKDWIFC
jgi:hypothetical protein